MDKVTGSLYSIFRRLCKSKLDFCTSVRTQECLNMRMWNKCLLFPVPSKPPLSGSFSLLVMKVCHRGAVFGGAKWRFHSNWAPQQNDSSAEPSPSAVIRPKGIRSCWKLLDFLESISIASNSSVCRNSWQSRTKILVFFSLLLSLSLCFTVPGCSCLLPMENQSY